MAVQQDRTAADIIEPHQQLHHCGFSGTGGAYNGDLLSGLYLGTEIVDHALLRLVTKGNMLKINIALHVCQFQRVLCCLHFFRFFEEFKDTFACRSHRLHLIEYLCDLLHGLGEVLHILDKRLNVTNGDRAANRQQTAGQCHSGITQIAHEHHDRLHQARQELGFPCGVVQGIVGFLKLLHHVLFLIIRLNHCMTGVGFFHLSVDVSQIFLLLLEVLLGFFHHQRNQSYGNRENYHSDQSHQRRDTKHHYQYADHSRHGSDDLGDALVQALSQCVHVVGDAGQHFAVGTAFKICHWHAVDFFRNVFPHAVADFLCDTGHQPALHKAEQSTQQIQSQHKQQNLSDLGEINAASSLNLRQQSVGKFRGRLTQNVRSDHAEHGGGNCTQNYHDHCGMILLHICKQFANRAFKVLRLFYRHLSASAHTPSFIRHLSSLLPPVFPPSPVPTGKAGTWRSADIPHSSSAVPHGCPCRQFCLLPEPESGQHGEWC